MTFSKKSEQVRIPEFLVSLDISHFSQYYPLCWPQTLKSSMNTFVYYFMLSGYFAWVYVSADKSQTKPPASLELEPPWGCAGNQARFSGKPLVLLVSPLKYYYAVNNGPMTSVMVALTWENISIVALARGEHSPILESHRLKRAATGKQTPALLMTQNNLNFSGHLFRKIHKRLNLTVTLDN